MMKSALLILFFFTLASKGSAKELDPFFKQPHNTYTINKICDYYFQKGGDAEENNRLSIKNSSLLKEQDYYLYLFNELARIVFLKHSGNIKQALKLLDKLEKDPFLKQQKTLKAYHSNISGNVYFQMESYSKAKKHYLRAVAEFKSIKDSIGWKGNLINTGNAYASMKNADSAFYFYSKAWHLDSLGVEEHHTGLRSNLARYYMGQNELEKATKMYEEVRTYCIATNDPYGFVVSSLNLGDCYLEMQKFTEAISILEEGMEKARSKGITNYESNFNRTLSKCYSNLNQFDKAYALLVLADSATKIQNQQNLEEFAEKLAIKHQEELRKKEVLIYKQTIDRKQAQQQLLAIFLSIAFVLLLIILLLYVQKRKKNKQLVEQNFKLVEQFQKPKIKKKVTVELIKQLEALIEKNNIHHDSELSLDKLAKMMDTNRTYLSENINAHYGYSFRVLLNKLRINEARRLLVSEEFSHYSIEGIAISVGYRNLSSFNSAFKKESGITPSYFRNQKGKRTT